MTIEIVLHETELLDFEGRWHTYIVSDGCITA